MTKIKKDEIYIDISNDNLRVRIVEILDPIHPGLVIVTAEDDYYVDYDLYNCYLTQTCSLRIDVKDILKKGLARKRKRRAPKRVGST